MAAGFLARESRVLKQKILAKAECHFLLGLLRVAGTSSRNSMPTFAWKIVAILFSSDSKEPTQKAKVN